MNFRRVNRGERIWQSNTKNGNSDREETVTGHDPATTESLKTHEELPRKREYSRRLRNAEKIERGVSRAAASLGNAVAATFNSYKDRSDDSRPTRSGTER